MYFWWSKAQNWIPHRSDYLHKGLQHVSHKIYLQLVSCQCGMYRTSGKGTTVFQGFFESASIAYPRREWERREGLN